MGGFFRRSKGGSDFGSILPSGTPVRDEKGELTEAAQEIKDHAKKIADKKYAEIDAKVHKYATIITEEAHKKATDYAKMTPEEKVKALLKTKKELQEKIEGNKAKINQLKLNYQTAKEAKEAAEKIKKLETADQLNLNDIRTRNLYKLRNPELKKDIAGLKEAIKKINKKIENIQSELIKRSHQLTKESKRAIKENNKTTVAQIAEEQSEIAQQLKQITQALNQANEGMLYDVEEGGFRRDSSASGTAATAAEPFNQSSRLDTMPHVVHNDDYALFDDEENNSPYAQPRAHDSRTTLHPDNDSNHTYESLDNFRDPNVPLYPNPLYESATSPEATSPQGMVENPAYVSAASAHRGSNHTYEPVIVSPEPSTEIELSPNPVYQPLKNDFKGVLQSTVTDNPLDLKRNWQAVEHENKQQLTYSIEPTYQNTVQVEEITLTLVNYPEEAAASNDASFQLEASSKALQEFSNNADNQKASNELRDIYQRALLAQYLHCVEQNRKNPAFKTTATLEIEGDTAQDEVMRQILAEEYIAFSVWVLNQKEQNVAEFKEEIDTLLICSGKLAQARQKQSNHQKTPELLEQNSSVFSQLFANQQNNFEKYNQNLARRRQQPSL